MLRSMKSLRDDRYQREITDRIARLKPDAAPSWGKMNAPQMVVHIADSLRMATGELVVASKKLPVRYTPLKQIIIYLAPFPKGLPTAPELVARIPAGWQDDISTLTNLVRRYPGFQPAGAWPEHPAFGRLTKRTWGVLAYRHIDHHLKQFGV